MFAAIAMSSALLSAAPSTHGGIYEVELVPELALSTSALAVAIFIDVEKYQWMGPPQCALPLPSSDETGDTICDSRNIPDFDRWVTREYSPAADVASDILLASLLLAPYAIFGGEALASDNPDRADRFGEEATVAFQTFSLTFVFTNILKVSQRRARPLAYNPVVPRELRFHGDAMLSFPSGHSSTGFAAATAISVTLFERHGPSAGAWIGAAGAYAVASAVGWLRMSAGKHFLTDVIAGAVIGVAFGLGVSLAHREGNF